MTLMMQTLLGLDCKIDVQKRSSWGNRMVERSNASVLDRSGPGLSQRIALNLYFSAKKESSVEYIQSLQTIAECRIR